MYQFMKMIFLERLPSDDSGDDILNDDFIPDPLSDDDCQDEEEEGREFNYGDDEILALGKTFNNAEEFKFAVLKYSLKTQYDIQFYKSSADRLGARCTQHKKKKNVVGEYIVLSREAGTSLW